jgi:hypothetical protein
MQPREGNGCTDDGIHRKEPLQGKEAESLRHLAVAESLLMMESPRGLFLAKAATDALGDRGHRKITITQSHRVPQKRFTGVKRVRGVKEITDWLMEFQKHFTPSLYPLGWAGRRFASVTDPCAEVQKREQPGRFSEFPPETSKVAPAGLQPQTGFR